MTYTIKKNLQGRYDIYDEEGNKFNPDITTITGEPILSEFGSSMTYENLVDIQKMFNLNITNIDEAKNEYIDKTEEMYAASGMLHSNNILFNIYLDKNDRKSRLGCIYIENKYDFKTKTNNLEIGCDFNVIRIVDLYSKIYNDILMNNIDRDDFCERLYHFQEIRPWLKLDWEPLHKNDKTIVFSLYKEIYNYVFDFCKDFGTYFGIDTGLGEFPIKNIKDCVKYELD